MLKCRSSHLTIFHIPSRMKKSIEKEIQRYLRKSEREKGLKLSEDRVDVDEYLDILRDAVAARNGWKRILERCSASRPTPRRGPQVA